MDKIHHSLINGLQSVLWDKSLDNKLFLSISESEWFDLYDLACKNTVEGLLFDVLEKLPRETKIPKALISIWCVRIEQIKERNLLTNSLIVLQLSIFSKYNIFPVLQKGQGIAQYYPKPLHRNCGDIDWYFENIEAFKKACEIAKNAGQKFSCSAMDAFVMWNGLETEFHTRLVETRNPFKWKLIKKLEKKYGNNEYFLIDDNYSVKLPAPILNILLVNIHILKHQITYGIGLRQLCDAAILLKNFYNKYNTYELYDMYKRLGVISWAHVFHGLLVKYMGLEKKYIPFAIKNNAMKDVDWMFNDMLRGGNFGFNDKKYDDYSSSVGRVNRTSRLSKSFRKYVKLAPSETIIFPIFQTFNRIFKSTFNS